MSLVQVGTHVGGLLAIYARGGAVQFKRPDGSCVTVKRDDEGSGNLYDCIIGEARSEGFRFHWDDDESSIV